MPEGLGGTAVRAADPVLRLREYYQRTPAMMHAVNERAEIVLVSDLWLDRLGYARDDVMGRPISDFLTEESRRTARANISRVLRKEVLDGLDYDMVTRSGAVVPVRLAAREVSFAWDGRRYALAVIEDRTAQVRAEDRATELNDRLQVALAASEVGIWDWDVATNHLVWDAQMYRIYGLSPEEFTGAYEAWSRSLLPGTRQEEESKIDRALTGEEKFDTEFVIRRGDGQLRTIRAVADVHRDEAGTPVRMLGANWDVTEERRAESEMERLIGTLSQANDHLERFAEIAAHDLRVPLGEIQAASDQIADAYSERLDETGVEYLHTIGKLGARLDTYLADLLEYGRLGQETMAYQETNSYALVTEIADTAAASYDVGTVEITIDEALPTLHCDRVKLAMVFGNLVRNGLKYSEETVRTLRIGYRWDPDLELHEFSVTDNGIGIDPKLQDRVFTLFKRLHGRDAYGGGSGMGLTLVQRAVERHGGSVWLESAGVGQGTTFRFTLEERRADQTGGGPPVQ